MGQLSQELDRISGTTQFNGQNLLDGKFAAKSLQIGANADQNLGVSITKMDAATLGIEAAKPSAASANGAAVADATRLAEGLLHHRHQRRRDGHERQQGRCLRRQQGDVVGRGQDRHHFRQVRR